MTPVALERFRPLVKWTDPLGVGSIEHTPPVAPHVDEPHFQQHPQMLRHRRLLHPQRVHNLPDGPLLQAQLVQNLPPARLPHPVARIRSSCCSCHVPTIHSHIGICQALFSLSRSLACRLLTSPLFSDSLAPNTPALTFYSHEAAHDSAHRSVAPYPACCRHRVCGHLPHSHGAQVSPKPLPPASSGGQSSPRSSSSRPA